VYSHGYTSRWWSTCVERDASHSKETCIRDVYTATRRDFWCLFWCQKRHQKRHEKRHQKRHKWRDEMSIHLQQSRVSETCIHVTQTRRVHTSLIHVSYTRLFWMRSISFDTSRSSSRRVAMRIHVSYTRRIHVSYTRLLYTSLLIEMHLFRHMCRLHLFRHIEIHL